jgi:hypothetical protein
MRPRLDAVDVRFNSMHPGRGLVVVSAGLVVALGTSGCGRTVTVTASESETAPPVASAPVKAPGDKAAAKTLNNPAQQPNPNVTAGCNEVLLGHACRASTAAPEDPNVSRQRNCDTNIVANANTSCALAENAFYEYYKAHSQSSKGTSMIVYSPATGRNYELRCGPSQGLIGCISSPTSAGLYVSFPQAAIDSYTEAQASAYARTRHVGNPGAPAASPQPQESPPSKPEGGHSTGEDEVGSYSHATDEAFCHEHECIGNFESEPGYVVECTDGTFSHAGGISGSCSHHGGNG